MFFLCNIKRHLRINISSGKPTVRFHLGKLIHRIKKATKDVKIVVFNMYF